MRVVFFLHRYWPHVGGVEKYVRHLAAACRARGNEVVVVAGDTQGGLKEIEEHEGIVIHRFPAYRSPWRCRAWMWRRRTLFTHADVVQVSNTHMLEYLWRMLGPVLDRRKIFLTRHGGTDFPVPEDHRRRAQRSLTLASGFIHDGEFIARWLEVQADATPRQGLFPPADRLPVVPEPPPTSAVYIGRLENDTGIRIFVDGVRELVTRFHRPMTLHVYGAGSLLPMLRAQVADQRLPVEFHGVVPDAQNKITDYCFAFMDGRMAIQEAMARQRVVVAAYGNPLRRDYVSGESFSDFLVSVENGVELAKQVLRLIDDPAARAALSRRAFVYAQTLSWDATAQAFEGLWKARLNRGPKSHNWWRRLGISWVLSREARLPNIHIPVRSERFPTPPICRPAVV